MTGYQKVSDDMRLCAARALASAAQLRPTTADADELLFNWETDLSRYQRENYLRQAEAVLAALFPEGVSQ